MKDFDSLESSVRYEFDVPKSNGGIAVTKTVQTAQARKAARIAHQQADKSDMFGLGLPDDLKGDYPFNWGQLDRPKAINKKYQRRPLNVRRGWNRVEQFAPELMRRRDKPFDVFEMSTAHGGLLEVCRHFGHNVLGSDYLNLKRGLGVGEGAYMRGVGQDVSARAVDDYGLPLPEAGEEIADWPYRPIIEAIQMPMLLFDGGKPPFPLADKSQDYLFCMQAIEQYCHPDDWDTIVSEFCRITRRAIIIYLNRVNGPQSKVAGYQEAFDAARLRLRNWDRDGFECTNVHIRFGRALGFRLTPV